MKSSTILVYRKIRNKKSIELEKYGRRLEKVGEPTSARDDLHFNKDVKSGKIESGLRWNSASDEGESQTQGNRFDEGFAGIARLQITPRFYRATSPPT